MKHHGQDDSGSRYTGTGGRIDANGARTGKTCRWKYSEVCSSRQPILIGHQVDPVVGEPGRGQAVLLVPLPDHEGDGPERSSGVRPSAAARVADACLLPEAGDLTWKNSSRLLCGQELEPLDRSSRVLRFVENPAAELQPGQLPVDVQRGAEVIRRRGLAAWGNRLGHIGNLPSILFHDHGQDTLTTPPSPQNAGQKPLTVKPRFQYAESRAVNIAALITRVNRPRSTTGRRGS
jgi:hypothetical protein